MNTRKFSGDMADQVEKDRDQLIEIKEVMSWASQNVVSCAYVRGRWCIRLRSNLVWGSMDPDLYEAIRLAWENRDK